MPQEFEDTFPQRTYTNCHQVWSDFLILIIRKTQIKTTVRNIPSHPGGDGVIGGGSHSKPENRPRENGSVITQIKQGVAVLVYDPSTRSGAEIR